ncbi:MAG TPA: PEGA domain-containing protein, partial [Candidatus Nanoarchaeia archaeon]|nr:PEGA domain-containing protein [Candidatus Nanoarchaeia archaeon]
SWQSSDGQFKVTVKDGDNIEVITGNGANLKPQCSDTIDNDQDTKIDYPADPGCTSVNDESEADTPPPSDEFKLTPSEVVMKVGEEKQVAMSGGKKPYSLTSLPDQSVVSIDFKEDAPIKIKGLKIGKTFFTAQDSNLKPKTVNITVSETGQDSLKVDKTSLTLKVGEQSQIKISGGKSPYTLIPPVATVGTEKIKVEFANDNSLVKVTGLKTGSASFGVKDSGSGQLTVEVNVIEDASSISSNPKDIVVVKDAQNSSLISGGTLPYVIDLVPLASIATASVSGNQLRVNGIGEGLAETKVRDSSSPKKTVTVPIEVRGKPNGLKADPSKISMGVGEQKQVQISGGLKAYSLSRTPSTSVASITDFGATTGLVKIKGEGVGGTSFGVRDSNAEIVIVQIDVSQNPPKKACSDGTDNDGDGKIDYPNDPGCTSGDDDSETDPNTLYQCSDGIDNDNDAKIDMADPGCTSSTDDSETDTPQNPACSDGKDNDGDGKIDYPNDPGCSSTNDNTEEDSQAKGGLHVVTIPDLAKVFVDGVRYRSPDSDPDKTPITVPNLDAGTHTLEIHKYGFYDYRESVTITGGQTNEKTITLESSTGNLRVISNPDSARVFVDGTRYKEPDGAGKTPLTVTGLEEGVHNIVISKDGYSSYASEVTIIAHQTKEMNAELTEALCGDGEINQPWEECDDGNTLSGDGCSFDCTIEEDTECPWYKPWKKCDPIIS